MESIDILKFLIASMTIFLYVLLQTSTIVTFIMVARGTLAQPLNCPSELYSRMFMLDRLKYGIIPLVEDLRNQTVSISF